MKKQEYIEMLVKLGLSRREARIYLALLNKSNFTATEIAKVSDIPRQKIYELLDNLIKKGVCIEKIGNIKRYKAVEPESVFGSLIDQLKSNFEVKLNEFELKLKEREKISRELSNDLSILYEKNRERIDPLEYIEVLKDKKQIHRRWISLFRKTKKEILAFTKEPYTAPLTEDMNEDFDALKRRVKIRSIYEYKDCMKEDFCKIISSWAVAGEETRIVKELPMKMIIFDGKITMFALNDLVSLKPSITTMIINHTGFAKAQKYVFEGIWEKAMPFENFKIKGV